jgi:thiol-disulfide isomerase/thioredoxin
MPSRPVILAAVAAVILAAPAHAAATIDHPNLGSPVCGPTVTAADLAGKVVLFDYWGIHCGPCLAAIPHLVELQAKYGRDNFVIIANQCQGGDAAGAKAAWTSHGGDASISVINGGDIEGSNVTGIPRCFLFDHEGKLVFDGRPTEVNAKLEEAMKASPGALVAGHQYTKTARYAAQIGALKTNLAPALKALRAAAAGTDAAAKEEAEFLLGRVDKFAEDRLAAVRAQRTADPVEASATLARMLGIFKGDELGKPFEGLLAELKADKAFQAELRAGSLLAEIEAQAAKLGLGGAGTPPKSALVELADRVKALQQKFPDSTAAAKSKQLVAEWKL